uniref:TNFR-Cys domain-containing protein n=1 Tax=Neogobius melanostomus TaxID=47308 RepID=A0A8C6UA73_9GOBI
MRHISNFMFLAGAELKVKTACSIISNTVCEAQEGHFCEQQSEGSCVSARKHRRCEPGEFTPSADTVCSPCDEGTFSNGTLSKCQPHTQCEQIKNKVTITAGTMFSESECGERNNMPMVIGLIVGAVVILVIISAPVALVYFKKDRQQENILVYLILIYLAKSGYFVVISGS